MWQHPYKVVPQSKGVGRSPWAGHSVTAVTSIEEVSQRGLVGILIGNCRLLVLSSEQKLLWHLFCHTTVTILSFILSVATSCELVSLGMYEASVAIFRYFVFKMPMYVGVCGRFSPMRTWYFSTTFWNENSDNRLINRRYLSLPLSRYCC